MNRDPEAKLYRYEIEGALLEGETGEPPREIIEAESELNAAAAFFLINDERPITRFRRVG